MTTLSRPAGTTQILPRAAVRPARRLRLERAADAASRVAARGPVFESREALVVVIPVQPPPYGRQQDADPAGQSPACKYVTDEQLVQRKGEFAREAG